MSKLRSLLDKVGDIKILNQNGFWSIQFENGTIATTWRLSTYTTRTIVRIWKSYWSCYCAV